jgi:hypothetical protein
LIDLFLLIDLNRVGFRARGSFQFELRIKNSKFAAIREIRGQTLRHFFFIRRARLEARG